MVFGELLGGLAVRAGERFDENTKRQREIEDWQRRARVGMKIDFMRQNWDNMDVDQQTAWVNEVSPDLGVKPKDAMGMITAAKGIHSMIPQIRATPESLGSTQRGGTVTTTPSAEPAVRGVSAPATPQFSQLPQPGEVLSSSTVAPTTGGRAGIRGTPMYDMTPAQILAQQKSQQAERERQQKVAEIRASGMSPEDQDLAIKALHIPAPVLAAQERVPSVIGGGSSVGLNTIEFVSPDGKKVITAQPTRTGRLVETGTGIELDPAKIQGWTKRHVMSPYMFTTPQNTVGTVNREEIARRGIGTIVGEVPEARVAETKTPLVNLDTGNIAGEWGSRSGMGGMTGTGSPAVELGRSPRPKAEVDARTYLDGAMSQLEQIQEIAQRRPDLVGHWDYSIAASKRRLGIQNDPDANNFINALKRFSEDAIRAKEGAVIPDAMYARLENIVTGKGWTNEQQFSDDIKNAISVLTIARGKRGMQQSPTLQGRTPRAQGSGATQGTGGGAQQREQFSKSKNAYRYTLDGGVTWQPGRLPK